MTYADKSFERDGSYLAGPQFIVRVEILQELYMHPISFISEHTAEYALVHDLVVILSREYNNVIPIYFWATREGGSMAMKSVGDCRVRVVSAYARRPKVIEPTDSTILMKVNSFLLRAGTIGIEAGSPVFAGVPLATGLLQFSLNTPCCWFHLKGGASDNQDINININLSGQIQNGNFNNSKVCGPLADKDILTLVKQYSRLMCWNEAVDCIRHVRASGEIGMRAFFLSTYRPFYLILPESNTGKNI